MAAIRRHPAVFFIAMATLCLAALVTAPWLSTSRLAAQNPEPQPGPAALDEVAISNIRNLREEVGLDQSSLIALNPTAEQAEQVLTAFRTWYEQNTATLHTHRDNIAAKVLAVRQLERQVRTGPANEETNRHLTEAKDALTQARQQRVAFLEGLSSAVQSKLTAEQVTTLNTLKSNEGLPLPYRLAAMTAEKRTQLTKLFLKHSRQCIAAASKSTEAQAQVEQTFQQQLSELLDGTQLQATTSYGQSATESSLRVLAAEKSVMPVAELAAPANDG